jgi:hypothetical protein
MKIEPSLGYSGADVVAGWEDIELMAGLAAKTPAIRRAAAMAALGASDAQTSMVA